MNDTLKDINIIINLIIWIIGVIHLMRFFFNTFNLYEGFRNFARQVKLTLTKARKTGG